jgi:hypothetical protein
MPRARTLLKLEQLEDRCVPSATPGIAVSTTCNTLTLSGTPHGELDVTHVGAASTPTFTITDNGVPVGTGTYKLTGGLQLNLNSEPADVKINLAGGAIPGPLSINLGAGYTGANPPGLHSVDLYDSVGGGKIGGSVCIQYGDGEETFNVGYLQINPLGILTPQPITIAGNLTVYASPSSQAQPGNDLRIGDGSTVTQSVSTANVAQFSLGSGSSNAPLATVNGDVCINDACSLVPLVANVFGKVGCNLTVLGTNLDDSFSLQNNRTHGSGTINGYLAVDLGNGQQFGDQILLGSGTTVNGNALLVAGNNLNTLTGDQFRIYGSVDENLTVLMGNTMNSLYFNQVNGPYSGNQIPFVGGSMLVAAGNGTNVIGQQATGEFAGQINGNLSFLLGSGDNGSIADPIIIAPITASTATTHVGGIGGTFLWLSGNGQDVLQLGDSTTGAATGNTYNFKAWILFGNNDDTFNLDIGSSAMGAPFTGVLTGTINGGGRVTANTFNLITGNDAGTTVTNFP